jgi:hypothetical protein
MQEIVSFVTDHQSSPRPGQTLEPVDQHSRSSVRAKQPLLYQTQTQTPVAMSMAPHQPEYYEREQLDDKRPLQDFHQFLDDSLIPADNPAARQEQKFVPFEVFAHYLAEDNRLEQLLWTIFEDEDPLPVEVSVVQETCLKVFCILLSIGKARFIRPFVEHDDLVDSHLPFHSKPGNFPASTCQPSLWDLFSEKQWMFCPAEMSYKIHNSLDPHRILPIVKREVLAEGGSAVVSKIVLHPSFNKLRREGSLDMVQSNYFH